MGKEEDDIFMEAMARLDVGDEGDEQILEGDDQLFLAAMDGLTSDDAARQTGEPGESTAQSPDAVHSHRGLKRQIKQGRLEAEAWLDLHRMTRAQAEQAVRRFLHQSHQEGRRLVGIICGQGLHSRGAAVLPEALDGWLEGPHSAHVERSIVPPREDGGQGARYVLLKRKRGPR